MEHRREKQNAIVQTQAIPLFLFSITPFANFKAHPPDWRRTGGFFVNKRNNSSGWSTKREWVARVFLWLNESTTS
jgi:hypothetical protein